MKWKIVFFLVVCLLAGFDGAFAQNFSFKYGRGKGQVSVYNANTVKDFKEDFSFGPSSFRVLGNDVWVLDSKGSRLFLCSANNEIKKEITVPGLPSNALLEDFALFFNKSGALEYFWVADAAEFSAIKVSSNGKELARLGKKGSNTFLQVSQLELDNLERLYVADIGASKLSIFASDGKFIRAQPMQGGGFALDKGNNLHLLDYGEKTGYMHRIYSKDGVLIKCTEIGLSKLMNPQIWGVNDSGSLFVSFIPAGGYKGHIDLLEISPNGVITRKAEVTPAQNMNRFLCVNNSCYSVAEADFNTAPAGSFDIKTKTWEVKK